MIHQTAIIDPNAQIGEGTQIGPYCVIGPDVVIGKDNRIGPHTVIDGHTTIGDRNRIGTHCSFGAPPQDLSYKDEPTKLIVGDHNFFGDFVQLTRGTTKSEHQTTRLGNHNYLMAYCHVGHDSVIGNHVIAANSLQLGGHATIEDRAVLGGIVAIHQHTRVGSLSMMAGLSGSALDIPPFVKAGGFGASVYGLNRVGLERNGVSREKIIQLKEAYKLLFRSGTPYAEALQRLEEDFADSEYAQHWVKFFKESKRGLARERSNK